MRTPTPLTKLWAWHRAAMAGQRPAITTEPRVGFFKRKFIRGGPWCCARIWVEQIVDSETGELLADEVMCCDVDGRPADPEEQWLHIADHPVGESEYNYLLSLSRYAKANDAREPLANPREKIDLMTMPVPEFQTRKRR